MGREIWEPVPRPEFHAGITGATNVGPANANNRSTCLVMIVTNNGIAAAKLTVADGTGTLYTAQVPATSTVPIGSLGGFNYTGQLAVTPSAALDVSASFA